jgi:proteasome lid subunit RPN8/RPN11
MTDYHLGDSLGLGNSKPILAAIKEALSKDHESCGVFYFSDDLDYKYLSLDNANKIDKNYFSIKNKKFYELYLNDKIISLFHSHTKDHDENPSVDDIEVSEALALPSMIFSLKTKSQFIYFPKSHKPRPLKKRVFIPYFQDCVSFVKDYYYLNLDIKLQEVVSNWARRREDPNEFLIEEMGKAFYEINESPRPHDIIVSQPSMSELFHLSIYGKENTIHHHPIGCYPKRELFLPESLNKVYKTYRHKDL